MKKRWLAAMMVFLLSMCGKQSSLPELTNQNAPKLLEQ